MVYSQVDFFSFIILSASMGFLSLLTPCVFPMVPITISFFLKQQNDKYTNGVKNAFIYILGIISSFSLIGILTAVLYGASGLNKLATNPWINLFIVILFVFFAFNLFGFFDIHINNKILSLINTKINSQSKFSILFMGVTFAITTFTCSMPLIGTILVSASQGSIFYPFIGMLSFGISFSLPFFILALSPTWLQKIPKSGDWLFKIKIVMGYIELAAAIKFLSSADLAWQLKIITREVFLIFWACISLMIGLYLLGIFDLFKKKIKQINIGALITESFFAFLFLAFSLYLSQSLHSKTIPDLDAFLPPMNYASNKEVVEKFYWYSNLDEAIKIADQQNKRILIDFTGYVCVNCRYMEQNILNKESVENLLQNFILVRLYTDGGKDADRNQVYQENIFKTVARPLYVIIDKNQKEYSRFLGMTREQNDYIQFLKNGLK